MINILKWIVVICCELFGLIFILIGFSRKTRDKIPFGYRNVFVSKTFNESPGVQLIVEGLASVVAGLAGLLMLLFQ